MKNVTMRKHRGYWTYETVKEESKKYSTRSEFRKYSYTAYQVAAKNKWFDEFTWIIQRNKPNGYWNNYEIVKEESLKYTSRTEFEKGCGSAYIVARINGWLDDFSWLKRKQNPYNTNLDNVYAYIFEEQYSVYVGRTIDLKRRDWQHHNNDTVYNFANTTNIPIPTMTILESGLTLEQGLEIEDYYVNKYREEGWNVLNKAKTGVGSGSLGAVNKKWTKPKVFKEAKKYTSRGEFKTECSTAYKVARVNGWLDDLFPNTLHKPKGYWNYEHCFEEGKKYKTRSEFRKCCYQAYDVARVNDWLDVLFPITKK